MNNIHIICNPSSGKGSAGDALNKIKDWVKFQHNLNVTIHLTENAGHATIITKELTSKNEEVTILVVGGDGTIGEVLNGIANFEKTYIGILPFGSGNDFVKALNFVRNDPVAMTNEYIYHPQSMKVDYLLINDKYRAINSCGLGMSAESIANRDKMKHFSPRMQYKLAVLKAGLFWKLFDYDLIVDGQEPAQPISSQWVTISNGPVIGGGFTTSTNAKVDDGLLTVAYLTKFSHIKTLHVINLSKHGKINKCKHRVEFNCKEMELHGKNMNVEYDGNLLTGLSKLNVKVVPNQLKILKC